MNHNLGHRQMLICGAHVRIIALPYVRCACGKGFVGACGLRDHPFKTSANNHTFLNPTPPTVGSFLVLSVGKFDKFLTPPPPRACRCLKWMVPYL